MDPMDVESASPASSRLPPVSPLATKPKGVSPNVSQSSITGLFNGTQSPFFLAPQGQSTGQQPIVSSQPGFGDRLKASASARGAPAPQSEIRFPSKSFDAHESLSSSSMVRQGNDFNSASKPIPFKSSNPFAFPSAGPSSAKRLSMSLPNESLTASQSTDLLSVSSYTAIPEEFPSLTPSYPAALFGGLSAEDEHVTVWEPRTGKTVAGNAAPYRRNLASWLKTHEGWEEKADELKSSKRRTAARRAKAAATRFASLCVFPIATALANDAGMKLEDMGCQQPSDDSIAEWSADDFVRLQESLFRVGGEAHARQEDESSLDGSCWNRVFTHVGPNKKESEVLYVANLMLTLGIRKSQHELCVATGGASARSSGSVSNAIGIPRRGRNASFGSPGSVGSYDSQAAWRLPGSFGANSLPNLPFGGGTSLLERSFRQPKEPRITVWHPDTGKTISGNAAPCRRNLESWMAQHPGWVPKGEDQLSSSRRHRKTRPSSVPSSQAISVSSLEGQSPIFDAVQGLLELSESPSYCGSAPISFPLEICGKPGSAEAALGIGKPSHGGGLRQGRSDMLKKAAITSSVSSSSGGEELGPSSDEETDEPVKMDVR